MKETYTINLCDLEKGDLHPMFDAEGKDGKEALETFSLLYHTSQIKQIFQGKTGKWYMELVSGLIFMAIPAKA